MIDLSALLHWSYKALRHCGASISWIAASKRDAMATVSPVTKGVLSTALLVVWCSGLALAQPAQLLGERTSGQRPSLMVLGTAHLSPTGLDVHQSDAGDVLGAEKQREMETVIGALAAWRPTHIAVEVAANDQSELDRRYAAYRAVAIA